MALLSSISLPHVHQVADINCTVMFGFEIFDLLVRVKSKHGVGGLNVGNVEIIKGLEMLRRR